MKRENRPLGRGLDNLLGEASGTSSINEVNIDSIQPNPDQPRRAFDEESLAELALSIQSIGLVQPITLKQLQDGTYLIISGERRWRACKRAGLSTIPAYIKTADDEQIMEMALIENIQREDLNAIEIALAYHRLLQNSDMKQEDLAKRVGKTRSSISNYLRLLRLPAEIQLGLTEKKIDMGHARAILALPRLEDQLSVYATTIKKNLSVRQIEYLIKRMMRESELVRTGREPLPDFSVLNTQLSKFFGSKVKITGNKSGKGKLTIEFANEAELAHIIERLEEQRKWTFPMRAAASPFPLPPKRASQWSLRLCRLVGCVLLLVGLLAFTHREAFAKGASHTLDELTLLPLPIDSVQKDTITQVAEFAPSAPLPDSLQMLPTPEAPLRRNFLATSSHFAPNPTLALLYALIPGGGQLYNRKYWKIPLVLAAATACTYAVSWNARRCPRYHRQHVRLHHWCGQGWAALRCRGLRHFLQPVPLPAGDPPLRCADSPEVGHHR